MKCGDASPGIVNAKCRDASLGTISVKCGRGQSVQSAKKQPSIALKDYDFERNRLTLALRQADLFDLL